MSIDLATFSRVTNAIYGSAADPTQWMVALREIQRVFHSSAVSLISRNMATMTGRWISTHDPDTEREFWGQWCHSNPFAVSALTPRPKAVETDQDILPKAALTTTGYYNEFWRPHDVHANLQLWLGRQGPVQPSLSVARSRSIGEFETADIALGRLLLPHVQRAVTVEQRLHHTDITGNGVADALDTLRHGVIIIEGDGRPIHLNRTARQLIAEGDGLAIIDGRVRAMTATATKGLDGLFAKAMGRVGDVPQAGAVALPRPSGKPALTLVAMPLRRDIDWLHPHQPSACICIGDPADRPEIPAARLSALFGLTKTEAAVAGELLAGNDVRGIAARHGIAPRTVRVHLSRIMAKTETSRQADLVRLLMNIAPFCSER